MLPKLTLPQTVREDARPVQTAAFALEAALDMHRDGTLDHLLVDRPGAARWLTRIFLQPILGAAGDALPPDHAMRIALAWLMEWAITQLRPDRAPTLQIDDRKAWLDSTSWRPMIAVMCHYGFASVPDFKDRYYRRPDETPTDNLCGLWSVGPSTYYRYLEKGKRLMARTLYEQRLDGRHFLSLWHMAVQKATELLGFTQPEQCSEWHHRQIGVCLGRDDAVSAFFHARQAGDWTHAIRILKSHASRFARVLAIEQNVSSDLASGQQDMPARNRAQLLIAIGEINRIKGNSSAEQSCYEKALRLAVEADDALAIGIVYSSLGKFYEPRDADRAFANYQESVFFLSKITGAEQARITDMLDEIVTVLTKLGWLYALRNDPRADEVLQRAENLRAGKTINDSTAAMLEQALGELCRRKGDFAKALEHKHRALTLYERMNDKAGVAKTYINLGLIYENAKSYELAVLYYQQILESDLREYIGVEGAVNTLLNLGACYFWQGKHDLALAKYEDALQLAQQAGLNWHIGTAHYNLAEAHYSRFVAGGNADDERAGDFYATQAVNATRLHYPIHAESALKLKERILAGATGTVVDQLVPVERAAHPIELSRIEALLQQSSSAGSDEARAYIHLQIAHEYLALALEWRAVAARWAAKAGTSETFAAALGALQATFDEAVRPARPLVEQWQSHSHLPAGEIEGAVLQLQREGFLTKSSYAGACSVSLATASKHLGLLTERGLLAQTGKGPATKYVLPETNMLGV
jgi:tetratricopeptide (TPR) repeat protein